jgi:hypothetical protein
MIAIILVVIVLLITWDSWKRNNEEVGFLGYKTSYFYLSQGESKHMFEKMREDGMGPESLKRFIMLEDRLLRVEQTSVCTGNPRVHEAFAISEAIKEGFLGYDFSYHAKHLKQVSEPHKLINRSLRC